MKASAHRGGARSSGPLALSLAVFLVGAGAAAQDRVLGPENEAAVSSIVGLHRPPAELGGCTALSVSIDRTEIRAAYRCAQGPVALILDAPDQSAETAPHLRMRLDLSAPEELRRTLLAGIAENERAIRWITPANGERTSPVSAARSPTGGFRRSAMAFLIATLATLGAGLMCRRWGRAPST